MKVTTKHKHVVVHVVQPTGSTRHLGEAATGVALLLDVLAMEPTTS